MKLNKKAFTLAEILIALVLIGFISTLIIPGVIQDTTSKQKMLKFKKAFNTINEAHTNASVLGKVPSQNTDVVMMWDILKKNLNIKAYYNEGTKKFSNASSNPADWIVTDDSIAYRVITGGDSCKTKSQINEANKNTANTLEYTCMAIEVDVDGPKEGNNTLIGDGENIEKTANDRVRFFVAKRGITPGNPNTTAGGKVIDNEI